MKNYFATIKIMLRKSILDVQGKTIEQSLHSVGYTVLNGVRIGKNVELTVSAESKELALEIVNKACQDLIANPIMEDYFIELNEI